MVMDVQSDEEQGAPANPERMKSSAILGIAMVSVVVAATLGIAATAMVSSLKTDAYYARMSELADYSPTHRFAINNFMRCLRAPRNNLGWASCTGITLSAAKVAGYDEEKVIKALRQAAEVQMPTFAESIGFSD
ncbi:hypothetical protein ACYPKM_01705 [Pseudomonas aeruginosa]